MDDPFGPGFGIASEQSLPPEPCWFPGGPQIDARPPGPGEVHLWRVDLDDPRISSEDQFWWDALNDSDRRRIEAIRHPVTRLSSLVGRGLTRRILAAMLPSAPAPSALTIQTGRFGKPACLDGPPSIEFNLSHSGSLVLLALASQGPLGIDVELLRPYTHRDGLIQRIADPEEATLFRCAPEPQRDLLVARLWTRKEACVKATGEGMLVSGSLDRLRVPLNEPPHPPHPTRWDGCTTPLESWTLRSLTPRPGYLAALAAPWTIEHLHARLWRFDQTRA